MSKIMPISSGDLRHRGRRRKVDRNRWRRGKERQNFCDMSVKLAGQKLATPRERFSAGFSRRLSRLGPQLRTCIPFTFFLVNVYSLAAGCLDFRQFLRFVIFSSSLLEKGSSRSSLSDATILYSAHMHSIYAPYL